MPKIPRPFAGLFWKIFSLAVRLSGASLLDLTTTGAHSGLQHTIPLAWFETQDVLPDTWLIVASFGGSPQHPDWYFNLARNPDQVWIRVDGHKIHVRPESLQEPERTREFRRIAALSPGYAAYEKKTDRIIPVVRLIPFQVPSPPPS